MLPSRTRSHAPICSANQPAGATTSFTAIALFSFDLELGISKDHAMAVSVHDATPLNCINSYTTPVDATDILWWRSARPRPGAQRLAHCLGCRMRLAVLCDAVAQYRQAS